MALANLLDRLFDGGKWGTWFEHKKRIEATM